ncbi:DUF5518 domain-containing protein [Natronolimnohabitans innermongolicus]|uniref:Uncharacterized protein n=1 Tax=Natronolimnohabitans innermongolicus JCM 12255 TaxID=1227499 RepID=L9WZB2_9EURY|nr:DUF5518 domain-containing protein [Natronolimnohabitans innermongolicus]ELY54834.1 hypothetical protein C493_12057 [Natronolimnohabitans innermongolicus JCM 12255]
MGRSGPAIDREWTYPVLVGLASVPGTLFVQWSSIDSAVIVPVFVAGLIVGSLGSGRPVSSRRVGWRTGLIGGIALLWGGARFVATIPDYSSTAAISVLAAGLTVVAVALYIAVFGVIGAVGAIVGDWATERFDDSRSRPTGR